MALKLEPGIIRSLNVPKMFLQKNFKLKKVRHFTYLDI